MAWAKSPYSPPKRVSLGTTRPLRRPRICGHAASLDVSGREERRFQAHLLALVGHRMLGQHHTRLGFREGDQMHAWLIRSAMAERAA